MLFRALITSLILSIVYVLATTYLIDGAKNTALWYVFIYWSLGFLSILGFIYGSGAMFFGLVSWSQISGLRKEFEELKNSLEE